MDGARGAQIIKRHRGGSAHRRRPHRLRADPRLADEGDLRLGQRFGEIIRGMDALAHVAVWDRLFSLTCPRPGGIAGADGLPPPLPRGERPQIMAAIGGIDIALWDIKGKHAGLPVWRLLGGVKRPIPTYATGGYYRPGAPDKVYAEELAGFVRAGLSRCQAQDRGRKPGGRGEAGADGARGHRQGRLADARHERALRRRRLHRVRPPGRAPRHLLAGGTAALVFAAGGLCAARGRHVNSACVWRARADALHGARLHCQRRDPLRAVRQHACRGVHRGAARGGVGRAARGHDRAAHRAELHAHLVAALPRCGFGAESHGDGARNPLSHHLLVGGAETRDSFVHLNDKPGFGVEINWDYAKRYAADHGTSGAERARS